VGGGYLLGAIGVWALGWRLEEAFGSHLVHSPRLFCDGSGWTVVGFRQEDGAGSWGPCDSYFDCGQ